MILSSFEYDRYVVTTYSKIQTAINNGWLLQSCQTLQPDYLRLIEESKPVDLDFRYVLIESLSNDKKEVCGAFYFQELNFTNKNLRLKQAFPYSILSKVFLFFRPVKILICGNIFAVNSPSLWFNPEKINKKIILEVAKILSKKSKCDVFILKDLDKDFTKEELSEFELTYYPYDITMSMHIKSNWHSLNDYLIDLSKKYRKRASKIIADGKSLERKELSLEELVQNKKIIASLFKQVQNNQMIKMGLINEEYIVEFKKRFPEIFTVLGYYYQNNLIGFATFIDRDDILEIHYIGFDYSLNPVFKLYFNFLFDGLEKAILENKQELELGRTAREAKANLGGKPVYFNDYYSINGRITSFLIKKIIQLFGKEAGRNWSVRHPFIENTN